MASAWGKSWGKSWGNSWGVTASADSGGNLATQDWTDVLNPPRRRPTPIRVRAYTYHDHRVACWVHIRQRAPVTVARHESLAFSYRPKIRSRITCQAPPMAMACDAAGPRLRFRAQAAHNPPTRMRLGGPLPITDHEAVLAVIAYKQR